MKSDNPAVREAYEKGTYTDKKGWLWRRGMDGWFHDRSEGGVFLTYNHLMIAMIEEEHPNDEPT